jgi:multidrug efflux pump subunit AcrB
MSEGFNLSAWTLRHQALVIFILALVTLFGVLSYGKLAQSEDPPFTFKVMVVRTLWPGATARQVQEEITDRIARKLQETPDVDFLRSYSRPGESTLFFTIKDAAPPAQLHDYAERLRTELLRVPDVNKVDFIADQEQRVYVEIANAQLAKLNLRPQQIADAVSAQNSVAGAGVVTTADDRVYVRPSGQFTDLAKLGDTLIRVNGRTIRLADIATISREYTDPPSEYMRFGNQTVLGIGVTMAPSGDVIALGKALDAETQRLRAVPVPYRSAQSVGASIAVDWFSASHWRCS